MSDGGIPNYVIDSYAILAFFQAEPGSDIVRDLLERASSGEVNLFMSIISIGEVYYITSGSFDDATAQTIVTDINSLPIYVPEISNSDILPAAIIKSQYKLSYADAFVVALSQEVKATVVTGDPEFHAVETITSVLWLPPNHP